MILRSVLFTMLFALVIDMQAQETVGTSTMESERFLYHEDMQTHLSMREANQAFSNGDYKTTILKTDELIEEQPGLIPALVLRARAKGAVSDTAGAFHDLRQIIKYNPDKPDGYLYLSVGYERVESYREALKWANQGLEKNPENPAAYMQRGEVKYLMGDKKGACLDWSKAGNLGDLEAYDVIFEKCTNVGMVR